MSLHRKTYYTDIKINEDLLVFLDDFFYNDTEVDRLNRISFFLNRRMETPIVKLFYPELLNIRSLPKFILHLEMFNFT